MTVPAIVLVAICVPLLAFATTGMALVFDPEFYSRGQLEQRVEQVSGLSQQLLVPANEAIVDYFRAPSGALADFFAARGVPRDFFRERETVHMDDVRGLVHLIQRIQTLSLIVGIGMLALLMVALRQYALRPIGISLIAGAGLSIALVLVVGTATLIDFGGLFVRLHLLSFTNEFWILDPKTDHLIQMFPFGFWYNAMLTLVMRSLAAVVAIGIAGGIFLRFARGLP